MNRVDTAGPPGRSVKDRGAAGVDLGAPGWNKTSYRRPVDNSSPRSSRSPTVSPCCITSAGMQLGYKSVLFILHFHLAGMNRGEPGRTVAPPWRTRKNRSVTGVLPAWTWVNRGEPAREPG